MFGTIFSCFEAEHYGERLTIKKVVPILGASLFNLVVVTATVSGLPHTWKQPLNYTMHLCGSTVHVHFSLVLYGAFGQGQSLCIHIKHQTSVLSVTTPYAV